MIKGEKRVSKLPRSRHLRHHLRRFWTCGDATEREATRERSELLTFRTLCLQDFLMESYTHLFTTRRVVCDSTTIVPIFCSCWCFQEERRWSFFWFFHVSWRKSKPCLSSYTEGCNIAQRMALVALSSRFCRQSDWLWNSSSRRSFAMILRRYEAPATYATRIVRIIRPAATSIPLQLKPVRIPLATAWLFLVLGSVLNCLQKTIGE